MALGISENKLNYKNTNFARHQRRTQEIQDPQKYNHSQNTHLTPQLSDDHFYHHEVYWPTPLDTKGTK